MAAFDREAFLAAARAAAEVKLVGVTLPGIGNCWVRPLTAGDWIDAHAAVIRLQGEGVDVTPGLRMAVGLAQNLCDDTGAALFSVNSLEDLRLLARLPAESVASALAAARGSSAPEGADPKA